jgi:hypothetical protein
LEFGSRGCGEVWPTVENDNDKAARKVQRTTKRDDLIWQVLRV